MSKKLEQTLAIAQDNIMGQMLQTLADQLGVTEEALERLGIGWLPVVEFKNSTSMTGWWAIPEYDPRGNLVGIGLRAQDGNKLMYPGGKRGLTFAVNQEHRNKVRYRPGAHNWVRTHEAGLDCPVCGKPDGCLLSKDDPEDPSAVICRVQEEGSKKTLGLGWLHILKQEAGINKNATLLAESDKPIVIVEGMTDAAAAISMGFEAVGRPSDRSGLAALGEMVRGRDIIVVGENDQKADGRAPGYEGMRATAKALQDRCPSVLKVMPPKPYKDLRTWYRETELTADEFLDYVKDRADDTVENPILKDDNPTTAARQFIKDKFTGPDGLSVARWMTSAYHVHKDGCYHKASPEHMEIALRRWSEGRMYLTQKPNSPDPVLMPVKQTKGWIGNVMAAIPAETTPGLFVDNLSPPMWMPGFTGQDPKLIIPFRNGLLDVEAWCRGSRHALMPHTPRFFCLHCLPYDFDPEAVDKYWRPFLRSTISDDPGKIGLLQEWYGYCLTGLTRYQKFLILVGARNSGKSVILNTLEDVVGEENVGAGDFEVMGDKFGYAGQVGKLVTTFDEVKITKSTNTPKLAQRIKQLSGEASVAVEEKGKNSRLGRLNCRMLMTCNAMPYINDTEDAMYRRLMVIRFEKTAEVIDDTLRDKFRTELPAIALWGLKGLRRLFRNGKFSVPNSMKRELDRWNVATNPIGEFLKIACEYDSSSITSESVLFTAFNSYMEQRHRDLERYSIVRFADAVCNNSNGRVRHADQLVLGHEVPTPCLTGIKLKGWAEQRLLVEGD